MARAIARVATLVAMGVAGLCGAGPAAGATLHVATNGTDGATCGGVATPCRSIGQAVANAASGDRILVQPGRYDAVHVDKTVTVRSSNGAGVTVVDGCLPSCPGSETPGVKIDADGVVFGGKGRGFTITRASGHGVHIVPGTTGAQVEGNLALGNWPADNPPGGPAGFMVEGTGHALVENVASGNYEGFRLEGSGHRLERNLSAGNTNTGIRLASSGGAGGHVAVGNVSRDNGSFGWEIHDGGSTIRENVATGNVGHGFDVSAAGTYTFERNVASANSVGFDAGVGTVNFTGDVASGNRGKGFNFGAGGGSGHTLLGIASIGNGGPGIDVDIPGVTITGGNVFGNDDPANCGVTATVPVTATGNFWGAASGPGADPADLACDASVDTSSFATAPFAIPVTAGRRPVDP